VRIQKGQKEIFPRGNLVESADISKNREKETALDLKAAVKEFAKKEGATIVGVSIPERFKGAPRGHHPHDWVPRAKSIVTFGVALLELVCEWENMMKESELVPPEARMDVLQNYVYRTSGYDVVNDSLGIIGLKLANFLESQGHRSFFLPATGGHAYESVLSRIPGGRGLLSQRHAAVRAGLGEFGLNNVVVTPKYGPRIRWNSVITEAEMEPDPLLSEKACLGLDCRLCVDNCPGAISLREGFDPDAVWYDTPARTDIPSCRDIRKTVYCYGRCIRICPVGKRGAPKA
jgi:epoxyqueuosine reductase QueG